jgi:hypothetical protein
VVDRHPGGAQATDDHPLLGQVAGDLEIAFVRVAPNPGLVRWAR